MTYIINIEEVFGIELPDEFLQYNLALDIDRMVCIVESLCENGF